MNVEQACQHLGISEEELFKKGYERYGIIFGTSGHVCDLAWWKKWGTVPLYVKKYIKDVERMSQGDQPLFI